MSKMMPSSTDNHIGLLLPQLKNCIDGLRRGVNETCYSLAFNDWTSGMVIEHANDPAECQNARQMLGYDADFPADGEICHYLEMRSKDEFFYGPLSQIPEVQDPIFGQFAWEDVEFEEDSIDQPFKDVHNWQLEPVEEGESSWLS